MQILIPRHCCPTAGLLLFCNLLCSIVFLSGNNSADAEEPAVPEKKPNILFLFADDQRADTIEAWGNPHIKTPSLNQLVKQGVSFRNNYCFGSDSGAVCIPSRAMVHSGKTWLQTNHQLRDTLTLGQLLQQQGYTTFATGKWHNGPNSLLRSFSSGQNVFLGGMSDHNKVPLVDIAEGKLTPRRIGQTHSSELFAEAAIEFLNQHSPDDPPFFAYLAFTAPHDPRDPPTEYRDYYYQNPPPLPENFLPQHPFNNGSLVIRDEMLAGWPRSPEVIQQQLCEYYGLITHLDQQIGRVLQALQDSPHANNTIVVYAADHGLAMGSHGLLGKQSLYEHSMKCPLIISGPGIPQDQQTEHFSYLYDIYPTLCKLCGIAPPADLTGQDLSPLWQEKPSALRDSVFLAYQEKQRAIRTQRWKLIVFPQLNHSLLFDLEHDPAERNNLANDSEFAGIQAELLQRMKASQNLTGDTLPLTTAQPLPLELDLTGRSQTPDAHQPQWILDKYFPTPQ